MLLAIRAIVSFYWRRPLIALAIVALMALQVGYNVFIPQATRLVFDRGIARHDARALVVITAWMAVAFVLRFVVSLRQDALTSRAGTHVVSDLRASMFDKLHSLSHAFYAKASAGDLGARFATDAMAVDYLVQRHIPRFTYLALNSLVCGLALFVFDAKLAAVTLVGLVIALALPRRFAVRASTFGALQRRRESEALAIVQETIGTHAIIKAFGLRDWRSEIYRGKLGELTTATLDTARASSFVESATTLAASAVQIIVVAFGAYLAIVSGLSVGTLFGFVGLLAIVTNGVFGLSQVLPAIARDAPALARIRELLDERSVIDDVPAARSLSPLAKAITFENVAFGYDASREILTDVDLTIDAGTSVALVGTSGSGKSTALSLLLRYYEPTRGHVRVDGHDVRDATLDSLRGMFGIVPQEPLLFNATVRENIRLGKPDATTEEIETAAKRAEIHDMVTALPDGYDTNVGERGGTLSGGQRQRLAIARALVREPTILLLDEATSALDPGTEKEINDTLGQVGRGRTVIAITHRLASAKDADQIVVFDKGRIVERGTHEALVKRGGLYADLWAKQGGFVVDAGARRGVVSATRLRAIPLFEALDEGALESLATRCASTRVEPGQIVFRAGDEGDLFYLIARGTLEFLTPQGEVGRVMDDGDYFGEIALLDAVKRTGTIRARTASLLLTLSRDDFHALVGSHPEVLARIRAVAEQRKSAR